MSAYLRDLTAQIRLGSGTAEVERLGLGYATLHQISLVSLALQLPLEDEAVAAICATKFEDLIEGLTAQVLALGPLQESISMPATEAAALQSVEQLLSVEPILNKRG